MKFDVLCRWNEPIARGSGWRLAKKLVAVPVMAALSLAATNSWAQVLANGDFDSDVLYPGEVYDIGSNLDVWITWAGQYSLEPGPDGDFAKHRETGGGGDEKLVQWIDASGISGKWALNLHYVYADSVGAQDNPQGRVSLVGIVGDRDYYMYGGKGTDGWPDVGFDAGSDTFKVLETNSALLAQAVLPFSSTWQHAITLVADIPADTYDYIGVVVQSGCYEGGGTPDSCETLRGVDNFVLYIDEEGPYTKHVAGVPNAAVFGTPFAIKAVVDDTERGNSTIEKAEYRILEGGSQVVPWTLMGALDEAFDMPFENVIATHPGLPVGQYQICVRGYDVVGNDGEPSCSNFVTYSPISESGLNIPIVNECAQFYTLENPGAENEITTLNYGETIVFDTGFNINLKLNVSNSGNVNFNYSTKAKGQGTGVTSGILYNFILNSVLRAKSDFDNFDPSTFTYDVKAKIVGQAQEIDGYGILNGAQNNAELLFKVRVHYANGYVRHETFDFSVECAGDPWTNVTEERNDTDNEPLGNGLRDPWNKYVWSMGEFNGGVFVGTKNGYYDLQAFLSPSVPVATCLADPTVPIAYRPLSCVELFGTTDDRSSRGSEIWRFDLKKKRWTIVYDADDPTQEDSPQGFRDMVVHNGQLYVAADLGAFISGVSYNTNNLPFTYPGVALLTSEDGFTFDEVSGCPAELCGSAQAIPPALPDVNISIRALQSAGSALYIGTFNASGTPALDGDGGGQVWKYDGSSFTKVWETGSSLLPIVGEIEVYDGKLYVGIGGDPSVLETESGGGPDSNNYLFECDLSSGCGVPGDFIKAEGLPDIDPDTFFVIKLFVGKDRLWLGTVNFTDGFSLLSYDGADWDIVVDGAPDGGFFNSLNTYAWSMAEVDGRLFLGSFNVLFFDELPRGEGELWYTDNGFDWFEYPMPLDWGPTNYGIRSMLFAGRKLFLGSASNMVAPDAFKPGGQVWTIRDTKVVKRGKKQ